MASHRSKLQYVLDFTSRRNDDLGVYAEGFFRQNYAYANNQRIIQTTAAWEDSLEMDTSSVPASVCGELYIHEDIMGSARRFSGADGAVYSEIEYDVWGLPVTRGGEGVKENASALNPRYTNHTYDDALGMYHAQHRFFDGDNRGFMQVDPVKDQLNWYGYCGNNPASFTDMLGLDTVDVSVNGRSSMQIDTSNKEDVLSLYGTFDDAVHTSGLGGGKISVYNYATSSPNTFTYDKNASMDALLNQAGIYEGGGGPAYFTKVQCSVTGKETYNIHVMDKYLQKFNITEAEILKMIYNVSEADMRFIKNADYLGNGYAGIYALYMFKEGGEQTEAWMRDLNWHKDSYALLELAYRVGQQGYTLQELDYEYQEKRRAEAMLLLTMMAVQTASAYISRPIAPLYGNNKYDLIESTGVSVPTNPGGVTAYRPDVSAGVRSTENMWGNPDTLQDHFDRHGSDFGTKNPQDYAVKANEFFNNRSSYQVKVDQSGNVRVYDPNTNTFGAYNANGTTRTYYKPSGGQTYFDRQPGQ